MNCTHPVIYQKGSVLYCHICGAALSLEAKTDNNPPAADKPAETPKPGRKRKAKGADGNENH